MGEYGEPQSRNETILQNMLGENYPMLEPQSRIETLLQALLEELQTLDNKCNGKMDMVNPVGSGSVSIGRKANTTIGEQSVAIGYLVEASGKQCFAEGFYGKATGQRSHAEGDNGKASGASSHVEGCGGTASGASAHSEGFVTKAAGDYSHAECEGTIANGKSQHAGGKYNVADNSNLYCEIMGNGTGNSARSNMRTLDWQGNEWLAGNLTVDGTISSNLLAIAQTYDPTSTYALDDYVFYNRLLYRCTTAIDTPEEWTAAHWTQCTVMGEIKRLTT